MVNGTVSLISLSDLLLLVYRDARNFCVLIVSCNINKLIDEYSSSFFSFLRIFIYLAVLGLSCSMQDLQL